MDRIACGHTPIVAYGKCKKCDNRARYEAKKRALARANFQYSINVVNHVQHGLDVLHDEELLPTGLWGPVTIHLDKLVQQLAGASASQRREVVKLELSERNPPQLVVDARRPVQRYLEDVWPGYQRKYGMNGEEWLVQRYGADFRAELS